MRTPTSSSTHRTVVRSILLRNLQAAVCKCSSRRCSRLHDKGRERTTGARLYRGIKVWSAGHDIRRSTDRWKAERHVLQERSLHMNLNVFIVHFFATSDFSEVSGVFYADVFKFVCWKYFLRNRSQRVCFIIVYNKYLLKLISRYVICVRICFLFFIFG